MRIVIPMTCRSAFLIAILSVMMQVFAVPLSQAESEHLWDFESDQVGEPPKGFSLTRTGEGRLGRWVIQEATGVLGGKNHVLAQVTTDPTDYRFPMAIVDEPIMGNGRLSVHCQPISGQVDQACGLVFRYQDANNYYVTRANAREGNVRLYTVQGGQRRQFATWNGLIAPQVWHELRVDVRGDHLEVFWDGQRVIDAHDHTFKDAGKVGVWTKADSVTYFDNLRVEPLGS